MATAPPNQNFATELRYVQVKERAAELRRTQPPCERRPWWQRLFMEPYRHEWRRFPAPPGAYSRHLLCRRCGEETDDLDF